MNKSNIMKLKPTGKPAMGLKEMITSMKPPPAQGSQRKSTKLGSLVRGRLGDLTHNVKKKTTFDEAFPNK